MISAPTGIVTAIIGGAVAQLFMKTGLHTITISDLETAMQSWTVFPFHTALILVGIIIYVVSMVVWVYALKGHKLSKAYPLLSLGYVVVYVLATIWPGVQEPFTTQKSIGIALIVFGVWYSQRSVSRDDA